MVAFGPFCWSRVWSGADGRLTIGRSEWKGLVDDRMDWKGLVSVHIQAGGPKDDFEQ